MIILTFLRFLPAKIAHTISLIAESIEEAHALRAQMTKKHRIGFDS